MDDRLFYIGVLKSNECQCGNYKKRKMAVCYECFNQLPQHMKSDLYLKIGNGFEESYDDAVKWLNQ